MWLFGSGAANALREDSDIDLLYEADPTLIQDDRGVRWLYWELEEKLWRTVELISKKTLDPTLQKKVFTSMIQIF